MSSLLSDAEQVAFTANEQFVVDESWGGVDRFT